MGKTNSNSSASSNKTAKSNTSTSSKNSSTSKSSSTSTQSKTSSSSTNKTSSSTTNKTSGSSTQQKTSSSSTSTKPNSSSTTQKTSSSSTQQRASSSSTQQRTSSSSTPQRTNTNTYTKPNSSYSTPTTKRQTTGYSTPTVRTNTNTYSRPNNSSYRSTSSSSVKSKGISSIKSGSGLNGSSNRSTLYTTSSNFSRSNMNSSSNVETLNVVDHMKIDVSKLDLNKISASAYAAQNNKYSKVSQSIWNSADLNITDRGDGTYLIRNGDIPIGFTNASGFSNVAGNNVKASTPKSESVGNDDLVSVPYEPGSDIGLSGKLNLKDLNLDRLSGTASGAYSGNFTNINMAAYNKSNLTYDVKDNGVVSIKNGDRIIGYTDILGVDGLRNSSSLNSFSDYTLNTNTNSAMYSNVSMEKMSDKYYNMLVDKYSAQEWNYDPDNSDGVRGTFVSGDREYNVYLQGHGAWRNTPLNEPSKNVAGAGCGVTSTCTVLSGLGYDITPDYYKNRRSAGDCYVEEHLDELGVEYNKCADKDEMLAELEKGNPVIYHVNNGTVGKHYYSGHYVALLGMNEDGDVFLADPGNSDNSGYVSPDAIRGMTSAYAVDAEQAVRNSRKASESMYSEYSE